jgi:predicted metal-dependent phosphoesterase TrpH
MKNADLHTHSHYSSDSDISPTDLVIEAKKIGLKYIALTDHDSVRGNKEFLKAGRKYKIETIPGVEIHSKFGEVLGFFVNSKKNLIDLCRRNKREIHKRSLRIVKRLARDGYVLNSGEIIKKHNRKILERPLIAFELVEKGYVESFGDAFEKLLGKGNKYYIDTNLLSTAKVIKIITSAGGLAVLAHPYYEDYQSEFKNIRKLIKAGLVGLECPCLDDLTPENFKKKEDYENVVSVGKKIKKIARKHNLILTSGSDYHGTTHPNKLGNNSCDESVIIALKEKLKERL